MDAIFENTRIIFNKDNMDINPSEYNKVKLMLEDATNPRRAKYMEVMYETLMSKSHIDFDDIPNSKGDIRKYSGYTTMKNVLNSMTSLAHDTNSVSVLSYIQIITTAMNNLERSSQSFAKGFALKSNYVMLEYNTYVYTCVKAVSSILYQFLDYIKRPDATVINITLKNTTMNADLFYINQLEKFNNVYKNMDYDAFLIKMAQKQKNNFLGVDELVGIAAIASVALAIVPVTREIIYRFYHDRTKLSDYLKLQAYYLDLNKNVVNANTSLTEKDRKKILDKQQKAVDKLMKLSSFIRVKNVESDRDAKKDLRKSNTLLSMDAIDNRTNSDDLVLM